METVTLRKGETLEQAQDRLATCKLFDLLDLGYCRTTPLKLFGYRIFIRGEKETATGYYYAEDNDIGDSTGYDLFIINFDTNKEGDGIGFVEPIDHDGVKTQMAYARSREFDSRDIIPFDPVYSYLVYNGDILPFESCVYGAERERLDFEKFSGKLEKIDLEKDLDWIICGGGEDRPTLDDAQKILDAAIQTGMESLHQRAYRKRRKHRPIYT